MGVPGYVPGCLNPGRGGWRWYLAGEAQAGGDAGDGG